MADWTPAPNNGASLNLRPRLPLLHTHARNMSTNTVDSDSSDSSAGVDDEIDTDTFLTQLKESSAGQTSYTTHFNAFSRGTKSQELGVNMEHLHKVSPIQTLPAELLITIFSKLPTSGDLRNCMLVCYPWALYTVNILWHRPLCNRWSSLLNVARALTSNRPSFAYHEMVKRLNLSAIAKEVNDGTVVAFNQCKAVERLTLTSCTKLTDLGVLGLVDGTTRLQALDVTDLDSLTDVTMLKVAQNCPRLQGLNITNCTQITDESLHAIALGCTQLKRLKLNNCSRATDESIIAVAENCRTILEIDLQSCHAISSASVTALLINLPQLRELRLAHCTGIDSKAFTDLPPHLRFDALRILDLTACDGIEDEAIGRIIPSSPRLRNLVLAKCRHITDRAVSAICTLTKNLHYIHLGHCNNLTDQAVIELVQACNRIRYIDLACCSRLTDRSVKYLARLPKLRRVGLVKCQNLTDLSIIALARGPISSSSLRPGQAAPFVSLERVHLSYCTSLTIKGITQLLLNCPRLTHLSLTGVQAFLRDDLTRFCREAPTEFTHIQRDVFCVFSGDGVDRLRGYLAHLARDTFEDEERARAQAAIDEPVLGPDSPDADSMSEGTVDGNDQPIEFVFQPGRRANVSRPPGMGQPSQRARPRSLHELPSFHVDMPLLPADTMQRVGPWTPGAPHLTPEMRAQYANSHLNLINSGATLPNHNIFLPPPRLVPTQAEEHPRSRSQSRRHTIDEMYLAQGYPHRNFQEDPRSPYNNQTEIFSTDHLMLPTFQTNYHEEPRVGSSSYPRSAHRFELRPDPQVSCFDSDREFIMSTIPYSSANSRSGSRATSPLPSVTRISSRGQVNPFLGQARVVSSGSAHHNPGMSQSSQQRHPPVSDGGQPTSRSYPRGPRSREPSGNRSISGSVLRGGPLSGTSGMEQIHPTQNHIRTTYVQAPRSRDGLLTPPILSPGLFEIRPEDDRRSAAHSRASSQTQGRETHRALPPRLSETPQLPPGLLERLRSAELQPRDLIDTPDTSSGIDTPDTMTMRNSRTFERRAERAGPRNIDVARSNSPVTRRNVDEDVTMIDQ